MKRFRVYIVDNLDRRELAVLDVSADYEDDAIAEATEEFRLRYPQHSAREIEPHSTDIDPATD